MGRNKAGAALESDVRRAIVIALRDRDLSAGEISVALDRPRPGVSHHLSMLLQTGVVRFRASGAHRYYSLNVEAALAAWDDYLRERLAGRVEGWTP